MHSRDQRTSIDRLRCAHASSCDLLHIYAQGSNSGSGGIDSRTQCTKQFIATFANVSCVAVCVSVCACVLCVCPYVCTLTSLIILKRPMLHISLMARCAVRSHSHRGLRVCNVKRMGVFGPAELACLESRSHITRTERNGHSDPTTWTDAFPFGAHREREICDGDL